MFNFFKTRKTETSMYEITYKYENEKMTYILTTDSEGLANIEANWFIDIIKVVKL